MFPNAILALAVALTGLQLVQGGSFILQDDSFWLNGQEVRIMSGSVHYFRIHPDYWLDRLTRARAMGLNAIQTYVAWNFHNPTPGEYTFSGAADLVTFIELAQSVGLMVLLRPGPFICAEWEFGGFPAWLFAIEPPITLRTYQSGYIQQVDEWWSVLFPLIQPLLIQNGGPIVMVQIENEFGSYGNVALNPLDKQYMLHLIELAREFLGNEIQLYTTDGGDFDYMQRGSLNGSIVYTVGDFGPGSTPNDSFNAMKQFNPTGLSPNFCSEYYSGWLSHWGEAMANTSTTEMMVTLEQIWNLNGSFNLYMAHGGTSFGFYAGANGGGGTGYSPTITSYDYDGPISEGGEHGYNSQGGDKFVALLNFMSPRQQPGSLPLPVDPPLPNRIGYGTVTFTDTADLLSNMIVLASNTFNNQDKILPMESYAQNYGLIMYSTIISNYTGTFNLSITQVSDRAHVFLRGVLVGVYSRVDPQDLVVTLQIGDLLQVLVEGMGRINYGFLGDRKGIQGNIFLNNKPLYSTTWSISTIPLESSQLDLLEFAPAYASPLPSFFRSSFGISTVADTFIEMTGWGKGYIWINGFNLGRYWQSQGPQMTLFIPAPLLNEGQNTLLVLELEQPSSSLQANLVGQPIFSQTPSPNPPEYGREH